MRMFSTAALAAFIVAGTLPALAQTTTPPSTPQTTTPKAKACKGRTEAECQAPDCTWVAATATKKAYCRKPPKKKSATASTTTPQN